MSDIRATFEIWAIDERKWAHSDVADKCAEGSPHAGEYRHCGLQDEWEVWVAASKAAYVNCEATFAPPNMHSDDLLTAFEVSEAIKSLAP